MEKVQVPRDAIVALIINTKKLCGRFPYTSIKECSYFEKELKNIFFANGMDSNFDENISNVIFNISDNGFITPYNDNYDSVLIHFFNLSSNKCKSILNNTPIIIDIMIKYMEREKVELSMIKKEILSLIEVQKTR